MSNRPRGCTLGRERAMITMNCGRKYVGLLLMVLVPLVAGLMGCEKGEPAPGPVVLNQQDQEQWEIALVEMRITKNEEFTDPARSPLPAAALDSFAGLNYYYPQPELHFRTPLLAAAQGDTVFLTKHKGQQVPYLRRGLLRFRHDNADYELTVFGPADTTGQDFLWLPFYDKTSGHQTYGGGRYLDIKADAQGMVDLDFNYAYNPLCDYDPDRFNCTLPPPENKLPFAVEAGEQSYGAGH